MRHVCKVSSRAICMDVVPYCLPAGSAGLLRATEKVGAIILRVR